MATKPTAKPEWTEANAPVREEPSPSKKNTGWAASERPPYQTMNWLFYNMGVEWLNYFEEAIDEIAGLTGVFDAYVGPTHPLATHSTLTAALAAVSAGSRILVLEDLALASTVVVSLSNIEIQIKPGVTISKSGAATGLQVSASGVRIKGGRMAGFSGGGDKAILIDVGSNYTMIGEMRFANNTTDVDDLNGTTGTYGIINE